MICDDVESEYRDQESHVSRCKVRLACYGDWPEIRSHASKISVASSIEGHTSDSAYAHTFKMPGQLYSRYVPPKKGTKSAQPTASLQSSTEDNVKPQLYARYVPPKKQQPAPADDQVTPFVAKKSSPDSSSEVRDDAPSKKRKREDNEKKSKSKERKHKTRTIALAPADNVIEQPDAVRKSSQDFNSDDPQDGGASEAQSNAHNNAVDRTTADEEIADEDQDEPIDWSAIDAQMDSARTAESEHARNMVADSILSRYSLSGGANRTRYAEMEADPNYIGDEDEEADAGASAILSKYSRSLRLSQKRAKKEAEKAAEKEKSPTPELHGLEPMPQPAPAPYVPYKANFSALPTWIRSPRTIQSDATLPFDSLKLSTKLRGNLEKKNFKHAMAVQTAVLPLLLPGREHYKGDVCVSAPTGSGKTLSYVLPMIEALHTKALTRLRGLIVVPTRELVAQAREVAELCAAGTGVKIGTAVGNVTIATEQAQLVRRSQRYDPEARKSLDEEADKRLMLGYDFEDDLLRDIIDLWPNHVPEYSSTVDILICTPGRLVDHLRSTPGFSLERVEWLIIDEADRLLDNNFQDWVDMVLPALELRPETDARFRIVAKLKERVVLKEVRKVILSATMTRDLSKLASLKLNRPTLVAVVEPEKPLKAAHSEVEIDNAEQDKQDGHTLILPSTLKESAIPVGDGSDKPLYLLNLLHSYLDITSLSTTVLIFCANDDNATRLARLIALLEPVLENRTAVLTKSTTSSSRKKTLNAFGKSVSIVISTDRTSRGLDVEGLGYVVNYDIPPSVTSYVHRIGRTARAGKSGEAWTLYTKTEARWFMKTIAQGDEISRGERVVERVRLGEADEDTKERYQDALQKLGDAVQAGR